MNGNFQQVTISDKYVRKKYHYFYDLLKIDGLSLWLEEHITFSLLAEAKPIQSDRHF